MSEEREPLYLHPTTKERIFNEDFALMSEEELQELHFLCLEAIEAMDGKISIRKEEFNNNGVRSKGFLGLKRARAAASRLHQRVLSQKGANRRLKKQANHQNSMTLDSKDSNLLRQAIREVLSFEDSRRVFARLDLLRKNEAP